MGQDDRIIPDVTQRTCVEVLARLPGFQLADNEGLKVAECLGMSTDEFSALKD